jgi:predicted nucleic acid-binding protein
MLAIDANLVVRFLAGDHPKESPRARTLIEQTPVFVPTTVLLETEWVLRSVYGFSNAQVVRSPKAFAGLPNVTLEDRTTAARALDRADSGMDFADALHLACSAEYKAFASFDQQLKKVARKVAGIEVLAP